MKNRDKQKLAKGWRWVKLGEIMNYEQPSKYLVNSTEYSNDFITPVLTAGKTFILGYTDEEFGIYKKGDVIIFDDFTTASRLIKFEFKIKSSAIKLLTPKKNINIDYIFNLMQTIKIKTGDEHKRRWISEFSEEKILLPPLTEQKRIAEVLTLIDSKIENTSLEIKASKCLKLAVMQKLLNNKENQELKKGWKWVKLGEITDNINGNTTKIKKEEIKDQGKTPVISQSMKQIEGYTDNTNIIDDLPLILFGDHTAIFKYIDFPFVRGADGTVLLKFKNNINTKYLFYYLSGTYLGSGKYQRHFKDLKEFPILLPPLTEQKRIAEVLTLIDSKIENLDQRKKAESRLKLGVMQKLLSV